MEWWNQVSTTPIILKRKSVHLAEYCWNNCDGISSCLFMFMYTQKENSMRTKFPIFQGCYSLLHTLFFPKLCCNFLNHHTSVLSDKNVHILLTLFSCQLFLPEHVCVLNIQLPSDTTGTHAITSVHMMKLPTDIYNWVLVLHEAFHYCTLAKIIFNR
jgi:hypothetical protein